MRQADVLMKRKKERINEEEEWKKVKLIFKCSTVLESF
jgi:hypothetical protein